MLVKPAGGLTNWELLYLKGSEIYANFHTRKKMLNFKFNLSFQKQRKMGFILTLEQQKTVGDSKDPIYEYEKCFLSNHSWILCDKTYLLVYFTVFFQHLELATITSGAKCAAAISNF